MNNCLCNFKKIKIYQFILLTMSIIIIFTKFVSASDWQNYENQFKYDKNQIPPCEYGKDSLDVNKVKCTNSDVSMEHPYEMIAYEFDKISNNIINK